MRARPRWLAPLLVAGIVCAARVDRQHPIDELHTTILHRFGDFQTFGMSRLVTPVSLGMHFRPAFRATRDLVPETPEETRLIEALEHDRFQVVFYLAGTRILSDEQKSKNYRALKGPAILTAGTPRPNGAFTLFVGPPPAPAGELNIGWDAIYPVAQSAMRQFGRGVEAVTGHLDGWTISTRPVRAFKQQCIQCHPGSSVGDVLGAAIYVYRRHAGSAAIRNRAPTATEL